MNLLFAYNRRPHTGIHFCSIDPRIFTDHNQIPFFLLRNTTITCVGGEVGSVTVITGKEALAYWEILPKRLLTLPEMGGGPDA